MVLAALLTACTSLGQARPEPQSESTPEPREAFPPATRVALPSPPAIEGSGFATPVALPTSTETEESGLAPRKLLNPCALMPADEVEALLGVQVTGDWRVSYMVPTAAAAFTVYTPSIDRVVYGCRYWTSENGQAIVNIEVFPTREDARVQMEASRGFYDGGLQSEGLHPIVEISGLADQAYSFVANPSEGLPEAHYPIIYFLSGNYLVTIDIYPSAPTTEGNRARFDRALAFARNALASLPEDIHSAMADQDYHLNEPWQPAGKPVEPCELITREEAQRHMDAPISFEQSNSYWGLAFGGIGVEGLHPSFATGCGYLSSHRVGILQGLPVLEGVGFKIDRISDGDRELYITHSRDRHLVEVSGIGDMAFSDAATGVDIVVLQGDLMVSVQVSNTKDLNAQLQSSFELAQLILGRLPE